MSGDISAWLMANGEAALFVTFFGALLVFGILEAVLAAREAPARLRRWPTNIVITALAIVAPGFVPLTVLGVALWADAQGFGLLNAIALPLWAAIVATLAVRSLVAWATHLSMHKVPALWRLHRVHHSDTVLDVSTTARFHPLEFVPQLAILAAATAAFGLMPVALVAYEILDALVNVFSHAAIRLPAWLDRPLRLVFVTPAVHRIHHSSHRPETDSNYGAVFTIWDRLFGTYVAKPRDGLDAMTIGLDEIKGPRASNVFYQLASPLFAQYRDRPE